MSAEAVKLSQNPSEFPADMTVGFIGAGQMARALAKGFVTSGLIKSSNIVASDPSAGMLQSIKSECGIRTTSDNRQIVTESQVVIFAVKPHIMPLILDEVYPVVKESNLFVSIAAGVPISSIETALPPKTRIMRVMPNTPALVSAGASVVSPGHSVHRGDEDLVVTLFSSIGICEVAPEKLLDAVTGVSGSGPAYAFAAIEALADGGVRMGLPRDLAQKLAAQTLLGAAKMVLETGRHPGELKDAVCSPGGTTIAAMHSLEKSGFRGILMDAVQAATERAIELGKSS